MGKKERISTTDRTEDQNKQQWQLFLQGDKEAYSYLYLKYVQNLYQFGCRFTDDSELVKDCIQDVFTQIYQNHKHLSLPDNVKVYLMSALKNCLFNSFKKKQMFNAYLSHVSEDKSYDFDLSIEETIIANETIESQEKTLSHVLKDLSSRQREIIYYRFYEGLEYEEICKLMDLNDQSAYNLLQRALSKLRETYGASFMSLLLLSISLGAESKNISIA